MISAIALEIAQNIGIDYHAATEELYYYMRKNDDRTDALLLEFNDRFYKNIKISDLGYNWITNAFKCATLGLIQYLKV
jgi:hypothetical protein